jgi:hypothetical protein
LITSITSMPRAWMSSEIPAVSPVEKVCVFGNRRQPAVGLEVALQGQIVLQFLAVEQRRVERVVVLEDRAEAGADEVGTGDQIGQDLGADADFRFGRARVVARGAFQVEPDGEQVLGHQFAHAARHGGGDGAPSMPPFCVPCTPMPRCRQRQRASR